MPPVRGVEPVQPVRRFRCSFQGCTAAFIKRAHLRRHEMTHTQRRDFVCPGCGRPFSRNDSMARHLRRKHPNLCQEQVSGRLSATPLQGQSGLGIGPSSASTSSVYGFPPVVATSSDFFHRSVSRDTMSAKPDPYLTVSNASYHRSSSQCEVSPGPHSLETETGPSATSSCPPWLQGTSSRDRSNYPNDSALQVCFPTSHPGNVRSLTKFRQSTRQVGREVYDGSSGSSIGPSYSAIDTSRNAQGQPFFRHPWQLRSYPTTKSAESSALSPASSSVRIGGSRFTPLLGREQPTHTSRPDETRFPSSLRAGDRDFDHIAPHYLQSSGSNSFRLPSDMNLLPDVEGSRPTLFTPVEPPSSYPDWPSTSAAPSFVFPSEHVEIESGLCTAGFMQDGSGPSDSMGLYDSCQSSSAANSYFKVDSTSFPARERSSIFHDTDNIAKFLSEIGLDLPFEENRIQSAMGHQVGIAKASVAGSSSVEQQLYGVSSAFLAPNQPNCSTERTRTPWTSTQGCSQDDTRSARRQSGSISPRSAHFAAGSELLPGTDSNSSATLKPASRTLPALQEGQSSDARDSARLLLQSADPHVATSSEEDSSSSFCMPHDSFRPPPIARDEEGLKIAAYQQPPSANTCLLPNRLGPVEFTSICQCSLPSDCNRSDVRPRIGKLESKRLSETPHILSSAQTVPPCSTKVDLNGSESMNTLATKHVSDVSAFSSVSPNSPDSSLEPRSPSRRSSVTTTSPGHTEASLQKIVDRFKAFARQCQAQLHPRADLLPSLEPLLPLILRFDAPIFHAKMVCSQKAHTAEEILALFALTSVRSEDPQLLEEGKRLACFLYGMVMLSFKLILHMGEKSDAFIKCFLLIGMRAMRQPSPDFWHKLKQVRDSVILDVTGASDRELDSSLDNISADDVSNLKDEALFELWLRWYSHESRKRTILLSAILDSQSSAYFQPLEPSLATRPEGPRCQFLFAHVYEPCPDNIFNAWPPEAWAAIVASCISLPSAKAAESAFCRGLPKSLAVILSNQLLKCHVRCSEQGCQSFLDTSDQTSFSSAVLDLKGLIRPSKMLHGAENQSQSTSSSKRSSMHEGGPRARIVSQLHMYALLEAINGAWMTDSAWYRTPAWGQRALPEGLRIDRHDLKVSQLTIEDLPGWRRGRSLTRHQVAHGLLNWSEMFTTSLIGRNESSSPTGFGLQLDEDVHHLMIRWQSIFLGLCAPMLSLCFFLSRNHEPNVSIRCERVKYLLQKWIGLPCGRRALVHASTILTLYHMARRTRKVERLGPAVAHAIYSSLVVITAVMVLLRDIKSSSQTEHTPHMVAKTENVPVPDVWTDMIGLGEHPPPHDTETVEKPASSQHPIASPDRSSTLYWHGRFEELGLTGIYADQGANMSEFPDWMSSAVSSNENPPFLPGPSFSRQRRGSLAEDRRWPFPPPRRDTVDGSLSISLRRGSYDRPTSRFTFSDASMPIPNLHRLHAERSPPSDPMRPLDPHRKTHTTLFPAAETRRWILQGQMKSATFCGLTLALSQQDDKDISDSLQSRHLQHLLKPLQANKPLWCYSESFITLLLAAFDSLASSGT